MRLNYLEIFLEVYLQKGELSEFTENKLTPILSPCASMQHRLMLSVLVTQNTLNDKSQQYNLTSTSAFQSASVVGSQRLFNLYSQ